MPEVKVNFVIEDGEILSDLSYVEYLGETGEISILPTIPDGYIAADNSKYSAMVTRDENNELQADISEINVKVVSTAVIPTEPTQPTESTNPTTPTSSTNTTVKTTASTTTKTIASTTAKTTTTTATKTTVSTTTKTTIITATKTTVSTTTKTTIITATVEKVVIKMPKVKLTAGKKLFKVKYTKVKNAVGFQIKYKTGKGKWIIKTFNTKKSATKAIKNLKKGKYKVQVRAFSKGKQTYSKWSNIKTVKVK